MREQLQRLIEVAGLPNVTLQVLPFSSGEHPAMDGDSLSSVYREPADPNVVFIGNTGGDMYIERSDITRRCASIFDHLRAAAQDPGESIRTLGALKERS
jgi:Domain of unknown function (DUF5753)